MIAPADAAGRRAWLIAMAANSLSFIAALAEDAGISDVQEMCAAAAEAFAEQDGPAGLRLVGGGES